jgi:hypothetical protein
MSYEDLQQALDDAWSANREHVERITLAAAVLATALHRAGMTATLVGGGAVEFHAPGAYTTSDIDLVVEGRPREAVDEVLTALGMDRQGRHWVRGDLFVEVPGNRLTEPADEFQIGPLTLRVIRKEYVLGDRIVGFRHWKYWGYGQQAIDLIAAFGADLNEQVLREYLRKEGAEHAYDLLRAFGASGDPVTQGALDALWHGHYR